MTDFIFKYIVFYIYSFRIFAFALVKMTEYFNCFVNFCLMVIKDYYHYLYKVLLAHAKKTDLSANSTQNSPCYLPV